MSRYRVALRRANIVRTAAKAVPWANLGRLQPCLRRSFNWRAHAGAKNASLIVGRRRRRPSACQALGPFTHKASFATTDGAGLLGCSEVPR